MLPQGRESTPGQDLERPICVGWLVVQVAKAPTQHPTLTSHQRPAPGCSGKSNIAHSSAVQLKVCWYKSKHDHSLLFRSLLYSRTQTPKSNFDFINLTNPGCWPVTVEYVPVPVLPLLPGSCCMGGTGKLRKGHHSYRLCTDGSYTHTVWLYRFQLWPLPFSGMNNNKYIGPQGTKFFAYTSKTQTGQTIQHLIMKRLEYWSFLNIKYSTS